MNRQLFNVLAQKTIGNPSRRFKCVSSHSEILARMEMWDAALKENVKDTGCDVADRQKMSHIVRNSDFKRYIMTKFVLRLCTTRAPKE